MIKLFSNKISLVLLFLILFISIGSVCATDDINNQYTNIDDINCINDSSTILVEDSNLNNYDILISTGNTVDSINSIYNVDTVYSIGSFNMINTDDTGNAGSNNLGNAIGEITVRTENEFKNAASDESCSKITFGNDITLANDLEIKRSNLIIDGSGYTLKSSQTFFSTLTFYGNNISIINCNFLNNSAIYTGSSILIDRSSSNCSIINCSFINNSAENGAVSIEGKNCSIIDSKFIGNTAELSGGAILIDNDSVDSSIINCTFINNYAEIHGGAILIDKSSINCSVVNCSFKDNIADNTGAAIFIYANNSSIISCNFDNNHAITSGGAINIVGTNCEITTCIFSNNIADNLGGAIYLNYNTINSSIINCNFTNNCAGVGGAIYINEYCINCSIDNCTFNKNTVISGVGGGISVGQYSDDCTIFNCAFNDNSASSDGGAISIMADGCSVANCIFNNNTSIYSVGGGIKIGSDNSSIINCTFNNNSASYYGGGVSISPNRNNNIVINCTFNNNSAGYYGGGVYIDENNINSTIVNSTFIKNSADCGGAIGLFSDDSSVIDCNFDNNYAKTSGGAICTLSYNCSILSSTFVNNSAPTEGGAIFTFYSDGFINDCTFIENSANKGGAISLYYDSDNYSLENCNFNNNTAINNGGAIYININCDDCSVINCTFNDNSATNGNSIYIKNSNETIKDSTFNGVESSDEIYIDSGSIFLINNAVVKGYIYNKGTILTPTAFIFNSQTVRPNTTINITSNLYDINGKDGKLNLIINSNNINLPFNNNNYSSFITEDNRYMFTDVSTIGLADGTYNLTTDLNRENYPDLIHIGNITINSINSTKLTIENLTTRINETVNITINVKDVYGNNVNGGTVTITINGNGFSPFNVINGKSVIENVKVGLSGNFTINAVYSGYASAYEPAISNDGWINVLKYKDPNISVTPTILNNIVPGSEQNITLNITCPIGDVNVDKVNVTLPNGTNIIDVPVINGKITINLPNEIVSGQNVTISIPETETTYTKEVSIPINNIIIPTFIVSEYPDGKDYFNGTINKNINLKFKIYDNYGNLVNNGTKVIVNVNGINYETTVFNNGEVIIPVKINKKGWYNSTVKYIGNDFYGNCSNITILFINNINPPHNSTDNNSTDNNSSDNGSDSNSNLNKKTTEIATMVNTGNPLLILIISLFTISIGLLKRKIGE